jgi:hypothetical protein
MVHCPRTALGKRSIAVMANVIIVMEEKRFIVGCLDQGASLLIAVALLVAL